ncbi:MULTISPECIES: hypothetical protein [Hymenobacter]|uniref:Uncharacterized protein n=1 Tax=Hymenobacter chitinivorans DSM 11115 TaxID=1121954 RepID=A0A2M9B5V2_9BACT|nr:MULTISPECIES: hypothetical protein [Hymenobacter]PJJ53312.1 hypothetical protein CLV45_3973 [Hymenobacter chitinivorans DSM 11115]
MSLLLLSGLAVAAALLVFNPFDDNDRKKRLQPVRVPVRNRR